MKTSVRPQHRPRFDHIRAKALRVRGFSYGRIAAELGVSSAAVRRVCDPQVAARMDAASRRWLQSGVCPSCGGPKTRLDRVTRCRTCAARVRATTVRDHELRCQTCHEWKPDDGFPRSRNNGARRGRHKQCTACQTKARTEWRHRNAERQRAYDRQRKRRNRKHNPQPEVDPQAEVEVER